MVNWLRWTTSTGIVLFGLTTYKTGKVQEVTCSTKSVEDTTGIEYVNPQQCIGSIVVWLLSAAATAGLAAFAGEHGWQYWQGYSTLHADKRGVLDGTDLGYGAKLYTREPEQLGIFSQYYAEYPNVKANVTTIGIVGSSSGTGSRLANGQGVVDNSTGVLWTYDHGTSFTTTFTPVGQLKDSLQAMSRYKTNGDGRSLINSGAIGCRTRVLVSMLTLSLSYRQMLNSSLNKWVKKLVRQSLKSTSTQMAMRF
uniref:ARAD1D51326p n=1 Tax=Blastobotrys adeninivorans TaxID=409370 RepID=A0A060TED7_BLAAD